MVADIGTGLSGLEQLRAFITSGKRPGIADALDFDLVEVGDGRAVFAGVPGPHAYNPMGIVHGGYFATLLDSACGCAVHSKLTAQQAYTTLELKIAFHKTVTAQTGRVRAEGAVITIGRRVAFAEARLMDANDNLYATATSTLLVMER
ncbi:MAG: PaaI family thioesterase [Rhodanobacter sp.]